MSAQSGAGHYVKMVHNGIEYSMMQGYAEGFELMAKSDYSLDLAKIADLWMHGSVVRSWLLELAAGALKEDPQAGPIERLRAGFRRRSLDDCGCHREGCAGPDADSGTFHAIPIAAKRVLCGKDAGRLAQCLRRPCRPPVTPAPYATE